MAENKAAQIITNVEPSIYVLAFALANKNGMTASAYLRKLIINDLIAQGLLEQDRLLEIVS